jgi:hypothetical protein
MQSAIKTGIKLYYNKQIKVVKYTLPVFVATAQYTHNSTIELPSEAVLCIFDYSLYIIEDYIMKLDDWRTKEAEYEEKTDPPQWNLNFHNQYIHIAVLFALLATVLHNIEIQIPSECALMWLYKFKKEKLFESVYNIVLASVCTNFT